MSRIHLRHLASLIALALTAALGATASFAHDHGRDRDDRVKTSAAKVKHVFMIVLENKNYSDTFGTSTQDPYLQKTLVPMGALLTQYYGTGHVSLDNYISMISGQAPTADTTNDCLPGLTGSVGNYNDVKQTGTTSDGQVIATGGCIYPKHIKTLVNQLDAAGLTWKGYMEDMGNNPAREAAACGHPIIGTGTDNTNGAEAPSAAVPLGDAYATRHNPFVYFHSIIDSPSCQTKVVNLTKLTADLQKEATTPNYVFITPNLCNDGHDGSGTGATGTTCANGQPGGLTSADAFLKTWVPQILASPAYRKDGLLIITFDESSYTLNSSTDASTGQTTIDITFQGQTCCNEQPGPNLAGVRPGSVTLINTPSLVENIVVNGYGGDRIGAVLLSPFIKPGSTSEVQYNHYSLLRSLEDIFRLDEHLGYAADNPRQGYFLDTIGNNRDIFEHDYEYVPPRDPHKEPTF
jgi:phosphatidylinositol-3-phosphatase